MDPSVLSSLILVVGGCVLALSALLVIRRNAESIADRGRLAQVEARLDAQEARIANAETVVADALDVATKARRIASRRQTKAEREAETVDTEPARPVAADPWSRMKAEAESQLSRSRANGAT